ncbi:MAG: acylphosphatase [Candidatus Dormiibacterota bacterium]
MVITPYDQRRHCLIGGRVQMVGFRMFATMHEQRLGLRGWIRNLQTGEVEVLAEGPKAAMDEFLELLKRGPAAAEVTRFAVSELQLGKPLGRFGESP